jgi:hypothetical protein
LDLSEHFVNTVKVFNDTAGRSVKMMSDFANVITSNSKQKDKKITCYKLLNLPGNKFDRFTKATLNE